MRHRSRKAKGRRLQVEVAELLARTFDLTIEAVPPTTPGIKRRAEWVREEDGPDLRVRQMSEAGVDVALLTHKAQKIIAIDGQPLHIECKNNESWTFDAKFWKTAHSAFVASAMKQANTIKPPRYIPVIILSKNRWEPIAVWEGGDELADVDDAVIMIWKNLTAVRLTEFVKLFDGVKG